jgi:putative copper resistance protein D
VLQTRLDAAAAGAAARRAAYVPGAGVPPPYLSRGRRLVGVQPPLGRGVRAGVGILALIERIFRARWARWPLLFAGLAVFLLIRSDPGLADGQASLLGQLPSPGRSARIFMALITTFAFFEWGVRTGALTRCARRAGAAALCARGRGAAAHSLARSAREGKALIEYTHAPLALERGRRRVALAGSELRGRTRRGASWIWPTAFALVGVLLILYREHDVAGRASLETRPAAYRAGKESAHHAHDVGFKCFTSSAETSTNAGSG